ncbi:sugar ABC transporter ATP-binding protein [Spongiactinospora sp. TRM90649]|uniref:sugar ABC transporter ATP-binding protein n=1 Tax=Spongiactinospora sp. TRM90649 TaxID=3031114 RepID=UPI0023F7C463|nr:sugar ABC transporter ATP-binding protein [Spongiactinospora sp. TRM90649]MDF5753447.1 sugar ABC transporter ATP-binding protein [Spongiactinospora sp. TRM90649]
MSAASSPAPPVVLSIGSLSKTFPAQKALDDVDLELRAGEVHCLLGQNGSGKSTLIKILAGYHSADPGATVTLNGAPMTLGGTATPERAVAFIHQDLGLVAELDAVDNLALGNRYAGRWWLSGRRERRAAARLLSEFEVDLDPGRPLAAATPGQQTMVAIVRAVAATDGAPALLVLDEPTASLPQHQVDQLFDLVRKLRDRGAAILYVTHRLREVFQIGDRVTVLRDGRRITTRPVDTVDDADELVRLIIGRKPTEFSPPLPASNSEVLLSASGVAGDQVADFSLEVRAGEIVGVSGLIGSGYDQALGLTFGARRRSGGEVRLGGRAVPADRPDKAINAGLAYAPADRKRLSTIPAWTVRENLTLPRLPAVGPARWLGQRFERREARPWIERLDVVPADPDRQLALLSGGNQQKVVLARWLRVDARVLLLDEPTSGVDAGAKASIYDALADIAAQGRAVVLSSSDAEELCAVCDRVLIMRHGAVRAVLEKGDLSVARIVSETIRDSADDPQEGWHS